MPKNKKSKQRFSSSVTRSGRCFSQRLPKPNVPIPDPSSGNSLQIFAEALAATRSSDSLSGVSFVPGSLESPVTPLITSTLDEGRWKVDKVLPIFESELTEKVAGMSKLVIGCQNEEVKNTGSDGSSSKMLKVDDPVVALDKTESVRNVVDPSKAAAVQIPSCAMNCKQDARINADSNTATVKNVPAASIGPGPPHIAAPVMPHSKLSSQSYASFFSSLPRCAGTYSPRVFTSSSDNPFPSSDIIQEGANYWKDHLVGFFLDSEILYIDVRNQCRKAWNLRGGLHVNVVNGMYYFEFSLMEERRKVLESDPAMET